MMPGSRVFIGDDASPWVVMKYDSSFGIYLLINGQGTMRWIRWHKVFPAESMPLIL